MQMKFKEIFMYTYFFIVDYLYTYNYKDVVFFSKNITCVYKYFKYMSTNI